MKCWLYLWTRQTEGEKDGDIIFYTKFSLMLPYTSAILFLIVLLDREISIFDASFPNTSQFCPSSFPSNWIALPQRSYDSYFSNADEHLPDAVAVEIVFKKITH